MNGELTAKQQLFVKEYLADLNATRAAIRAGYSEKTARSIGAENMTKPDIVAAIEAEMEKRIEQTEITAESVLKGILGIVEAATAEGKYAAALRGYELLGKHLKMFTDKVDLAVRPMTLGELVAGSYEDGE